MIAGSVRNHEAIIEIEVFGRGQSLPQIEAVIDTGYNGFLTLPGDLVSALQLPFAGHRRATLADGNVIRLDVYMASVIWHGRPKEVLIAQATGIPLVGMALLEGNSLSMKVVDGGEVTIVELP